MKFKSIIYELNLKFILLTLVCFVSVYKLSSNNLQVLNSLDIVLNNQESLKSIENTLYTFLFFKYDYNIINYIGLSCIYLIGAYFILDNVYQEINNLSLYKVIRLKSYSKYFFKLFLKICSISFIYFFIGFSVMFAMDYYQQGSINLDCSKLILKLFLLANIITISLTFFTISVSIILNNVRFSIVAILSIFCISIVYNIRFLPGYYCILSNSINEVNLKFLKEGLVVNFSILISGILIILNIIKNKIDKFLKLDGF